nr:WD repeat-containing protein 48-like [Tanacetum cinerariifolium]
WWKRSFSVLDRPLYERQRIALQQGYLTDLSTRDSALLCSKEHPIQQLALHDDGIWVATTDSSVHRWPSEGLNPEKVFQRGGSFLAGNLSFSRARASLEGSTP